MLRRDGEVFFLERPLATRFGDRTAPGVLAKNVVGSNPHRNLAARPAHQNCLRRSRSGAANGPSVRLGAICHIEHGVRQSGKIPAAPATIPAPPLRQYRLCRQSTARMRVRRHRYRFRPAILREVVEKRECLVTRPDTGSSMTTQFRENSASKFDSRRISSPPSRSNVTTAASLSSSKQVEPLSQSLALLGRRLDLLW